MNIIGNIFMILGGVFLALGGFGVFRMPDVFNRIQAGTKATTLGAFSMLLGVGLANPSWLIKSLLIIVFIAVTNPVGSSALARAAHKRNVKQYAKETGKAGE
ncbi:MAG TPA: monovalent cation/H(+) antiporter subunit G [Candidatus Limiplasma sp.]|nr:monovalent cation/H(+) antiporter subunit G [Candidatus Limiplasma sp.]HRX09399.1 monovalent cation/H(+) antiporter subunit G [Candidatus Limiplasma sp.]